MKPINQYSSNGNRNGRVFTPRGHVFIKTPGALKWNQRRLDAAQRNQGLLNLI